MNLAEEIDVFFKQHQLNDFAKIRYIYLVVCETFSYDTRFIFATSSMKKDIYDLELDIKNIEEYEIICYTQSKMLQDLLNYFGYQSDIIKDDSCSPTPHAYVVVKFGNRRIKLDPTLKHDTARVKMNANTYEFNPLDDDPVFEDDIKEADEAINQACENKYNTNKNFYATLNQLSSMSVLESDTKRPDIRFFDKLHAIFNLVNMKTEFTRYDDIDYYFGYILKRTKINEKGNFVKPAVFFNKDDKTMKDIINIILVEFEEFPPVFYIMEKVDGHYMIRSISGSEVLKKLEQYDNWRVNGLFENAAKRAVDGDFGSISNGIIK